MDFRNKKILIIGMARSGMAAARTLVSLEAEVTISDLKSKERLEDEIQSLADLKLKILAGEYPKLERGSFDLVVTSPGVPMSAPVLVAAREKNIPIWSEIELASRFCKCPIIAITGTNGKTTTTSLIGQIFRQAGKKTIVGGNIGKPLITQVLDLDETSMVVVEVSSFQLEWVARFKPKVAIITNLTPDHLDRHGDMDNYGLVKSNIFKNQQETDYTIINYDDLTLRKLALNSPGKVLFFSKKHILEEGIFVLKEEVIFALNGQQKIIGSINDIKMPGEHNLENALAAIGAACVLGIESEAIKETLLTFKGVEHRLEEVSVIKGVTYINDSKGTNPEASIKALQAFQEPLILIAGGSTKHSDFSQFAALIKQKVKKVIVLGETTEEITAALQKVDYQSICKVTSLEEAVTVAAKSAEEGDIVLLSPACASYDMFRHYEHRGEVFKELVLSLKLEI